MMRRADSAQDGAWMRYISGVMGPGSVSELVLVPASGMMQIYESHGGRVTAVRELDNR